MPHDEEDERPALRWRTLAAFIVLITAIAFFLLGALMPLRGDLNAPAFALLGAAATFFFGVNITAWLPALLRAVARGLVSTEEETRD